MIRMTKYAGVDRRMTVTFCSGLRAPRGITYQAGSRKTVCGRRIERDRRIPVRRGNLNGCATEEERLGQENKSISKTNKQNKKLKTFQRDNVYTCSCVLCTRVDGREHVGTTLRAVNPCRLLLRAYCTSIRSFRTGHTPSVLVSCLFEIRQAPPERFMINALFFIS